MLRILSKTRSKGLNRLRVGHLFIVGKREVGAHLAVEIVSKQNDTSLFGLDVERVEM